MQLWYTKSPCISVLPAANLPFWPLYTQFHSSTLHPGTSLLWVLFAAMIGMNIVYPQLCIMRSSHLSLIMFMILPIVPKFSITPTNITVPESTPEVMACILAETSLARDVIVTAQTGPKNGATAQATGSKHHYISIICSVPHCLAIDM